MKELLSILLAAGALALQAATYYVSSSAGNDSNAGTRANAPWKTLEKVNSTDFQPGDRILLESGSVWQGQLAPRSSGAEGKPIIIDRHGKGRRPRIDANGKVEDALRLYNVQQIEVRNLELTNTGPEPALRRGVHVFLDNFGTAKHILISGLYIHDVNGTNKVKDNGGIIFRTNGNKTPSRYDGLTIERNIIWKVDRSAIAAQSYHSSRAHWFPSVNVVIRDNFAEDIGGDGIVPWATESALIEHNIVRDCNRRANTYNAGIWPWSADNSVFQLNEAAFTRTTLDGQGFDSDYNSRNTLFQYNYSHDNEGGFMLICNPGRSGQRRQGDRLGNIGNIGTIVRRNISRNDHSRIFLVSAVEQATVEHNVIYTGKNIDVQMVIMTNWSGWADNAVFRGNTFYSDGVARYGHEVSREKDGRYGIGTGWGPAKNIVFEGNRYIGRHVDRPEDPKGVVQETASTPKLDWNAPAFDPSAPDGFDAFIKAHRRWIVRLFERQFGSLKLGR